MAKSEINKDQKLKEFISFRDKHWHGGLTTLQLVISTHLYIENGLDDMLKTVLSFDENIANLHFSSKMVVASSIGLDKKDIQLFKAINSLRNKFAHQLDYQIKWNDVVPLDINKQYTKKDWDKDKIQTLGYILSGVLGTCTVVFEYGSKIKLSK